MNNRLLQSFDDDDLFPIAEPSEDSGLSLDDDFHIGSESDFQRFVFPVLIGLAVIFAGFALLGFSGAVGGSNYRTADNSALILRGSDVEKLEPNAAIIRGKEIIGSVSECGYENGRPIAVLELDSGLQLEEHEHCHVEKDGLIWAGSYVVKVTGKQFDGPVRFLDIDTEATGLFKELPSTAVTIIGLAALVGVCLMAYRIIKSSFFWIVATLVVFSILYFLTQQGFSPFEFFDADQFHTFFEE